MMNEELKRCPACNHTPYLRSWGAGYKVWCHNWFCNVDPFLPKNNKTKEEAIEAWNKHERAF